jgi:hypothetical protein
MKPTDRLHLVTDVRDLQIIDSDEENCGIVDDIELEGAPGKKLTVAALLIGPGAYRRRLPRWMAWLSERLAGTSVVRVPWSEVRNITSVVQLTRTAGELGLDRSERRAAAWLPRLGGLDAGAR